MINFSLKVIRNLKSKPTGGRAKYARDMSLPLTSLPLTGRKREQYADTDRLSPPVSDPQAISLLNR